MTTALVADNDIQIRLQVGKVLKNMGFDKIVEAENGRQAVELSLVTCPQLVVLDANLPDLDGVIVAEKISRRLASPIVMLATAEDPSAIERAQHGDVMGYVLKPFREGQLYAVIDLALYRSVEMSHLHEEVAKLKENLEIRKLVERAKGVFIKQGMSEPEAYRRIQKISMDRRTTIKEVAEAILLLGG
jgi:response regulator NasT